MNLRARVLADVGVAPATLAAAARSATALEVAAAQVLVDRDLARAEARLREIDELLRQ